MGTPFDPVAVAAEFATKLASRTPLLKSWDAGTPLVRCHPNRYGPAEFYAGSAARFSPFLPLFPRRRPGRSRPYKPLPVLYAADGEIGALSETVFRDLPLAGRKTISRAQLRRRNLSTLTVSRDLRLADLTGHGLRRLGVTRRRIIESDRRQYPTTALFSQAIHAHPERFDGMVWVSRQHDLSLGIVLFSDRVLASEVDTSPLVPTFPLEFGHGREMVDLIADQLGITVVDP